MDSTSVAITSRHSSIRTSLIGAVRDIPALFTTTSTCPNAFTVAATIAATASPSVTSVTTGRAAGPAMSPAVSFSADSRRPARVTWQPSAASRNAVARPIPEPAPVTIATGGCSISCMLLLAGSVHLVLRLDARSAPGGCHPPGRSP